VNDHGLECNWVVHADSSNGKSVIRVGGLFRDERSGGPVGYNSWGSDWL